MKSVAASALALFGLAACAGPGGISPSGGLMYRVPDTPSVVYLTESSQDISLDVPGMGPMTIQGASTATLALTFAPAEGGVQVTAAFDELTASMDQPMAPLSATESDIVGELVFVMDERGRGTVVSLPELRGSAEQLANPAGLVHSFFPRLPGGTAAPGETWTDTIKFDLQTSTADASTQSILTYTLVGDTVVDGADLLYVTYEGEMEAVTQADNQGMEMIQSFSGDVTGMFLWDPARGLMVFSESDEDLEGTTEIPAAGMAPIPMTVRGTGWVRLQGG